MKHRQPARHWNFADVEKGKTDYARGTLAPPRAPDDLDFDEDEDDEVMQLLERDRGFAVPMPGAKRPRVSTDGNLYRDLPETLDANAALHYTSVPSFVANFKEMLEERDPVQRIVRAAFLFSRFNFRSIECMNNARRVYIPLNFALFRPQDYRVMKGIVGMQGGEQTGAVFWSRSSIQIGSDANTKVSNMNLTWWFQAVIIREDNVQHMANVCFDASLGGHGSNFFTSTDLAQWRHNKFTPWNESKSRASCFSIALSPNEPELENRLDVQGVPVGSQYQVMLQNRAQHVRTYTMADFYRIVYHFAEMTPTCKPGQLHRYNRGDAGVNTLMCRGYFEEPFMLPKAEKHKGTGHLGPFEGPGYAAARDGLCVAYPDTPYNGDAGATQIPPSF